MASNLRFLQRVQMSRTPLRESRISWKEEKALKGELMGKKLLFVYNPKAGKAQIRAKLADILDVFAA